MRGWVLVRPSEPADRAIVESFLDDHATAMVARLGELVDTRKHPALIAEDDTGGLAGVLTYVVEGDGCEVLTLHAAEKWRGAGTLLLTYRFSMLSFIDTIDER